MGQVEQESASTRSTKQVNSQFEKFTINYSGKKGVYAVTSGVLRGPVLGATVSGTIDMRSKGLSLSGTYIPVYGVNNIFSRLPVLGRALGNRKNEGLLGVTYQIKGSMDNPTVVINPASILAPGALRKLFEFR
ncbi:AsmA-like C-terminal domain-containing protein [uncultured Cohaesibacter sp.]|uniref:AsmA-like C-terminal domain-containing protein n=1 Tax=uncultured Cohaesibacter sp. TaxID=1002546 RepID=UPI0029C71654|nr:AsmA-like C-terminal domain-containing protein [uncultured Cohaesibacter sp.]